MERTAALLVGWCLISGGLGAEPCAPSPRRCPREVFNPQTFIWPGRIIDQPGSATLTFVENNAAADNAHAIFAQGVVVDIPVAVVVFAVAHFIHRFERRAFASRAFGAAGHNHCAFSDAAHDLIEIVVDDAVAIVVLAVAKFIAGRVRFTIDGFAFEALLSGGDAGARPAQNVAWLEIVVETAVTIVVESVADLRRAWVAVS